MKGQEESWTVRRLGWKRRSCVDQDERTVKDEETGRKLEVPETIIKDRQKARSSRVKDEKTGRKLEVPWRLL